MGGSLKLRSTETMTLDDTGWHWILMCELQLQHAQFSPNQIKCCGSKAVRGKNKKEVNIIKHLNDMDKWTFPNISTYPVLVCTVNIRPSDFFGRQGTHWRPPLKTGVSIKSLVCWACCCQVHLLCPTRPCVFAGKTPAPILWQRSLNPKTNVESQIPTIFIDSRNWAGICCPANVDN